MVSLLFHGRNESEVVTLRERLKVAASKQVGPPWSCREEPLGEGRYRVSFVTAPVCVRQAPLEGTCEEIIAEFERRLAR
jgi:hypothetical protein